jgi:hypothetical protein
MNKLIKDHFNVIAQMYRIAWRSLLTGFCGRGEFLFQDRATIVEQVEVLNRNYAEMITHWIESEESQVT